jgi:hypothetical protein
MDETLSKSASSVQATSIDPGKMSSASPAGADGLLDLEYILPLKWSNSAEDGEMTAYLHSLSSWVDVTVVDGSAPEVFQAHHQRWSAMVRHVAPRGPAHPNGKVHGVLTGLAMAGHERIVIADDDVRYTRASLQRMSELLEHAEIVRPQNYFADLPWHAQWDTARSLINRALGSDFPGTLGVRASTVARGYRGDVLFENLELIRTVKAAGGREILADDLFIERLPPTAPHFWGQRVRQAYDSQAQPTRLAIEMALLPALVMQSRNPWGYLLWAAAAVGVAAIGRHRDHGRNVFGIAAPLWAPLWVLERSITTWVALARRLGGGMPYAGGRLKDSASPMRELLARHEPRG